MTVTAALMLFFSLGGFVNAVALPTALEGAPFPQGSPAAQFMSALSGTFYLSTLWVYASAALAASYGAFKLSPWTHMAFAAWAIAALAGASSLVVAAPSALVMGGKAAGFTFVAAVAGVAALAYRYIRRQVTRTANAAP